jgi:hypothetical protein
MVAWRDLKDTTMTYTMKYAVGKFVVNNIMKIKRTTSETSNTPSMMVVSLVIENSGKRNLKIKLNTIAPMKTP